MVPSDRTILCVELSYLRDEPVWQAGDDEVFGIALGRRGLFLNNSMDDNELLGMKVADQVKKHAASGKTDDVDSVGWLSEMPGFVNLQLQGK